MCKLRKVIGHGNTAAFSGRLFFVARRGLRQSPRVTIPA